jgi:chromosome segregation ATPase
MASKKTYKRRYKKYKKKYKKYKSRYRSYKDQMRQWQSRAQEYQRQMERSASDADQWRADYEDRLRTQQATFQRAQMDLTNQIRERSGEAARYRGLADTQAAQISGFQGQIADFNAANAAREMQEKVAADYGNLVGSVGSVSTNRRGENAYRQRWFRRPEALPPGYQQPLTITDQATNV